MVDKTPIGENIKREELLKQFRDVGDGKRAKWLFDLQKRGEINDPELQGKNFPDTALKWHRAQERIERIERINLFNDQIVEYNQNVNDAWVTETAQKAPLF